MCAGRSADSLHVTLCVSVGLSNPLHKEVFLFPLVSISQVGKTPEWNSLFLFIRFFIHFSFLDTRRSPVGESVRKTFFPLLN